MWCPRVGLVEPGLASSDCRRGLRPEGLGDAGREVVGFGDAADAVKDLDAEPAAAQLEDTAEALTEPDGLAAGQVEW